MQISSAIFDCSAPDLDSCPDEFLPEFAFIGRSNVGKSSLLNMLSGKVELARTSDNVLPGFQRNGCETYAEAMTNPQDTSDSKAPLKWGFFITKIGLSELCQKKIGFLVFPVLEGNHQPIGKN